MHSFDFLLAVCSAMGMSLRSSSRPTVMGLTSPSRQHNLMFTRFPFPHYYIPFSYLAIYFRNFSIYYLKTRYKQIFIIEIKKGTQCLLFLLFVFMQPFIGFKFFLLPMYPRQNFSWWYSNKNWGIALNTKILPSS